MGGQTPIRGLTPSPERSTNMKRRLLAWFLAFVMFIGAFSSNAVVADASILTDLAEEFYKFLILYSFIAV